MTRFKDLPALYRRIIIVLIIINAIYLSGTVGYLILEDEYTVLDAFYMTAITLATVGFHEVGELHTTSRIFTIILIIGGVTALGYAVSSIISIVVEGHLKHTFRDRKMQRDIDRLQGHIIVCGHGRMGSQATKELDFWRIPFVIVEQNPAITEKLKERGILCIEGSAYEDEVLLNAGVQRARGLIAALAHDTDNLFVVLTARRLGKELEIVTRAEYENSEVKLLSAGANKVLLPTQIAGRRMACMLVYPEVASFLDVITETSDLNLSLQEFRIPAGSKLDGVKIVDCKMPHAIRIIGLKPPGKKMIVNPPAHAQLTAGSIMIILGENQVIEQYKRRFV